MSALVPGAPASTNYESAVMFSNTPALLLCIKSIGEFRTWLTAELDGDTMQQAIHPCLRGGVIRTTISPKTDIIDPETGLKPIENIVHVLGGQWPRNSD